MPRSPVARMLIILACLDLMFTATLGYTFIATMGLEGDGSRTAAAVIAGLWVVKVIAWLLIISKKLKPLARWFSTPQAATDPDTIREVAITLYRAPFSVSAIWAVAFGGTCMLNTLVLYFVCAGSVPLGPRAIEAQVFSNLGILLGAAEMTFPLTEWLLAPMIESVSLAAQARAVEIPGHGLTFRSRLVVFALALALAPSLFLSGIAYMNDARAEQRDLTRQAELAAAEAALGHDAAAQVAGGWTFTYDAAALEARSTRTTTAAGITGRDAAQALADRPHLTRMFERAAAETATGSVTHPREGVVAFRTEGGRRVGVVIPRVASAAFSTLMLLLMALAVVALWGPLSALFIGNSTAVPVVRLSNALTRVGAGEVADAPKVPVFHQDEVGTLARSYNAMLDQLREFARRVNEVSKGDLAVELQVRGDLGNALRDQVTSLRDIVSHIAQSAMQLAGAASEMYAAAQEQEMTAHQQTAGVTEVSRTMDSLLAAANHVTETTMGVLARAERTRETTSRMAERITEMSAHAGRIGMILDVIREIADRSDLLALNASLEGAHAGEAGRGFALVAGEMRKLAERVTISVADTQKLVGDVRASVSAAALVTEESTRLAEGTAESAHQINLVTQQQRSGTEQAGQNMRDVAVTITQSLAATQQIRSLAEDLKLQADNLTRLVARFRLPDPHASARA